MSDYVPTTKQLRDVLEEVVGDTEGFDRWLATVKAEAWQEGVAAQCAAYNMTPDAGPNPYRKERP